MFQSLTCVTIIPRTKDGFYLKRTAAKGLMFKVMSNASTMVDSNSKTASKALSHFVEDSREVPSNFLKFLV